VTLLRGSTPALVTPLAADGTVHERDLVALVARAVDDGASGVLVAGSTGEGALLDPDQRVQVTRTARGALDADDGRSAGVLLAGASGPTSAELTADVERLAEAGADAVLVLAPSTYPLTADELVDLHLAVAEATSVPTLVYHLPQYTGSALTPEALRTLAAHPRIVGVKDSSPDADRRARFVAATDDVEGFVVLTGHAPTLRAALEAGAAGSITAIANLRQRQVVALHTAVATGGTTVAADEQAALTRTSDALSCIGASLPAAIKAALQLEGVIEERWCRPPLRSVPPDRLDRVRTALVR
jgi:4-hydroxy-tetrahydrodipicolinate synthase